MRRSGWILTVCAACCLALPTMAQDMGTGYVGLDFGADRLDGPGQDAQGITGDLVLGYDYAFGAGDDLHIGVEANYGLSNADDPALGEAEGGYGVGLVVGYQAAEYVQVYGRLGYARQDFVAGGVDRSEGGARLGVGTAIDLSHSYRLRLEYSQTEFNGLGGPGIDLDRDQVNIGVLRQF